jgi:hypothetical protein
VAQRVWRSAGDGSDQDQGIKTDLSAQLEVQLPRRERGRSVPAKEERSDERADGLVAAHS